MNTQELVGTDVEIINALDFEPELACESLRCAQMPSHPAFWLLTYECGCAPVICHAAKIQVDREGPLWRCLRCEAGVVRVQSVVPIGRKK